MNQYLLEWYCKFPTYEDAVAAGLMAARYGTYMHTVYAKLTLNHPYSLEDEAIMDDLRLHADFEGFNLAMVPVHEWVRKIKQDVWGYIQFMHDYEIDPIAVEISFKSDKTRTAGQADLIANLTVPVLDANGKKIKGETERITGLIDWKTGRQTSFYDNYKLQGIEYLDIVNDNFPGLGIQRAFLYGCKDWTVPLSSRATPYRFAEIDTAPDGLMRRTLKAYHFINDTNGCGYPKFSSKIKAQTVSRTSVITENAFEAFDPVAYMEDYFARKALPEPASAPVAEQDGTLPIEFADEQ